MFEVICRNAFMMLYALMITAISTFLVGAVVQAGVRRAVAGTLNLPALTWSVLPELLIGIAVLAFGLWFSGRLGAGLGRHIDDIRSYHWPMHREVCHVHGAKR